uniref:Putative secreted protein n=1 Tax=Anopheles marajoara TaxID=58244 RepID=A0A2M4C938_9DIPT
MVAQLLLVLLLVLEAAQDTMLHESLRAQMVLVPRRHHTTDHLARKYDEASIFCHTEETKHKNRGGIALSSHRDRAPVFRVHQPPWCVPPPSWTNWQ